MSHNMLKKGLAVILIGSMIFGNLVFGQQASLDQKADTLNKMNILKGDGTSYNLKGQLTRAEGATFIVRLLGQEKEVLEHKIDYLSTDFSDVKGSSWYAPYVGYCVKKGIINGYLDGTFKPTERLNEQAFVKMALGALGYEYNKDFNWAQVFAFAYAKGIVTDEKYKTMTKADSDYTRGEVIQLIYNLIDQPMAQGGKRLIDSLVSSGVLTASEAAKYGFAVDEVEMKVEEFRTGKDNQLSVTFNEAPKSLTKDNIIIKEKESSKLLEIERVLMSDSPRQYYIKTAKQVADLKYVIVFTGVRDAYQNIMPDADYEFFGYRGEDYASNYFKISKIINVSASGLDLYMTQPVDLNRIRPTDLSLSQNGNAILQGNDNNLSIQQDASNPYLLHLEFLNYQFVNQQNYELQIGANARSQYGAYIGQGNGDYARFSSQEWAATNFELVAIKKQSDNSLLLIFNRSLNQTIAEQVFSYYLTTTNNQPIKIQQAVLVDSGVHSTKAVELICDHKFMTENTYHLLINQAYDTNRTASILEYKTSFRPELSDKATIVIESVKTIDYDKILVTLDSYLDEIQAKNPANYVVENVIDNASIGSIQSVYYDRYSFKPSLYITFDTSMLLKPDANYRMRIKSDSKTADGVLLKRDATYTFGLNKQHYLPNGISTAYYVGDNSILISGKDQFELDVNNVLTSNYTLQYNENGMDKKIQPIGVNYLSPNWILLKFEQINTQVPNRLTANKIKTLAGESIDLSKKPMEVVIQ